jgi:hypothetical protein
LLGSDGLLPVIFERRRAAQVVFDFLFQLGLRHHLIERRLRIKILSRPDAVTPVNFFNTSLIGCTLCKAKRSLVKFCPGLQREESQQCPRQKQNQVKRVPNKMRFNCGMKVRFHFDCPCLGNGLLHEERQRCRDVFV